MGNRGNEQGPPGTAKSAIGVNASQHDPNEMRLGGGNPGPTADGRRKPDVVAPGCDIRSSRKLAPTTPACNVGLFDGCSTSKATPAVAAATALIRQYYVEGWYPTGTRKAADARVPAGALIKATLLNATLDMTDVAGYPSDDEGWGLVRLNDALYFAGSPRRLYVQDVRHASGLATGESRDYRLAVGSSARPLKVTLVWSDAPGTTGAASPVV